MTIIDGLRIYLLNIDRLHIRYRIEIPLFILPHLYFQYFIIFLLFLKIGK